VVQCPADEGPALLGRPERRQRPEPVLGPDLLGRVDHRLLRALEQGPGAPRERVRVHLVVEDEAELGGEALPADAERPIRARQQLLLEKGLELPERCGRPRCRCRDRGQVLELLGELLLGQRQQTRGLVERSLGLDLRRARQPGPCHPENGRDAVQPRGEALSPAGARAELAIHQRVEARPDDPGVVQRQELRRLQLGPGELRVEERRLEHLRIDSRLGAQAILRDGPQAAEDLLFETLLLRVPLLAQVRPATVVPVVTEERRLGGREHQRAFQIVLRQGLEGLLGSGSGHG
jgi:hypothetical protein